MGTCAFAPVREGAFDFLQKPFNDAPRSCPEAVQFAAQRGAGPPGRDPGTHRQFTARESDVSGSMVAGRLNKQIAEGLGISIKTVEQHRARVMEKLQVDSSPNSFGWSSAWAPRPRRTGSEQLRGTRSRPRQVLVPGFPDGRGR